MRSLDQRSNVDPIWVRGEGRNPWLLVALAASVALLACIMGVPALQGMFGIADLEPWQWATVLGLSALSIVQIELVKLAARRRRKERGR